MPSVHQLTQPLIAGEKLYLRSRVSLRHASLHAAVDCLLVRYWAFTPGCDAATSCTWLMLDDAPRPDVHLRIRPEYGGQSRVEGEYASGAPELVAEISCSCKSYDLGPKLNLYRKAGVREYIAVLLEESNVIWRRMLGDVEAFVEPDRDGILRSIAFPASGAPELVVEISLSSKSYDLGPKLNLYRKAGVREYIAVLLKESKVIWRGMAGDVESFIEPDRDGILRSIVCPGLWLDPDALLKQDLPRMMKILDEGLHSLEHERFVEDLARKV
ncbi:MAG: Uma2 family endonuclease [Acidobacteriota bacterium]|nr:Uma2 family endonuclease [Acidobacteriota bacterium]